MLPVSEIGSHCVTGDGIRFQGSGEPPGSASLVLGPQTYATVNIFFLFYLTVVPLPQHCRRDPEPPLSMLGKPSALSYTPSAVILDRYKNLI